MRGLEACPLRVAELSFPACCRHMLSSYFYLIKICTVASLRCMLYLLHPLLKAATRISFLCSLPPKSPSPCLLPAVSSFSRVTRNTAPRIIPAHSSSFIDMSGSAAPEALPVIHLTPTESALFRQLEEFATYKSSSGTETPF